MKTLYEYMAENEPDIYIDNGIVYLKGYPWKRVSDFPEPDES